MLGFVLGFHARIWVRLGLDFVFLQVNFVLGFHARICARISC